MARNGSGQMNLLYNWQDDDANTIPIRSDRMQLQDQDIADALTASIAKDGQTTPTANLTMGGFKLTSLGAGTVTNDAAQIEQTRDGTVTYIAVSGTDTYTATPSPAISAYAAGQGFKAVFTNANTGAATLNLNSLGAKAITKNGTTALVAGDIVAGMAAWLIYDGTRFQLIPSITVNGPYGLVDAGIITAESATAHVGKFQTFNCSASARTCLLQSALTGQVIGIGKYGTNTLTLNLVGQKYLGNTSSPVTAAEGISIMLMTDPTTRGFVEG